MRKIIAISAFAFLFTGLSYMAPSHMVGTSYVSTAYAQEQSGLFNISLGASEAAVVATLGEPNRKDLSPLGYTWFIYNSDPSKYVQIGIADGKVVDMYSNAPQAQIGGVGVGTSQADFRKAFTVANSVTFSHLNAKLTLQNQSSRILVNQNNQAYVFYVDRANDNKISAIRVIEPQKLMQSRLYSSRISYYGSKAPNFSAPSLNAEQQVAVAEANEKQVFDLLNVARSRNGLPPLTWNESAAQVARSHSKDMKENNFFGSMSPTTGKDSSARLNDANIAFDRAAEFISGGTGSAIDTYENMIGNSSNRNTILEKEFTTLGVGAFANYYTKLFVTPSNFGNVEEPSTVPGTDTGVGTGSGTGTTPEANSGIGNGASSGSGNSNGNSNGNSTGSGVDLNTGSDTGVETKSTLFNLSIGAMEEDVVKQLGSPARMEPSGLGYTWWIYNSNPSTYVQIGIQDGKVVDVYSNGSQAQVGKIGIGSGEEILRETFSITNEVKFAYKGSNIVVQNQRENTLMVKDNVAYIFYLDKHDNYKVTGIRIMEPFKMLQGQNYAFSYSYRGAKPDFTAPTLSEAENKAVAEAFEKQVFDLANVIRVRNGLPLFTWNEEAAVVGRGHSKDMKDNNFFAHMSPTTGKSVGGRLKDASVNYRLAGENLATGMNSAIVAHEGWMNSLGHRKNMLNKDFATLGVGVVLDYYTQVFVTPFNNRF
ncbi:CAP-associated domain-containing protein [Paenibacillus sp. 481]|uniref:CAP-associated domain-containing protein n=1 Tax=Paenibacillus sp. 481 TaxID=2835869 RepID=UPI001E4672AF|nr:CAP-associated domain-containing protein [Paenibacillus sp. 481]UHA71867.1 hypothetical protein KIK04_14100 [Paenibacillus sp. 481]